MQIFPDIHLVDGVVCNVYIITEPGGLTIIDAGMPGAHKRILAAIHDLGYALSDVRRILLTHQHVDHIGGLAALTQSARAETWASAADALAIEGKARREAPHGPLGLVFRTVLFPGLRLARITHTAHADDTIPTLEAEGGLRVVETPGHTMGHLSFYLPGRRLLFAGDAARSERGRILPPPAMVTYDMRRALASFRALADLEIEALLPGHGAPITTEAQQRMREQVATETSSANQRRLRANGSA